VIEGIDSRIYQIEERISEFKDRLLEKIGDKREKNEEE
jgi:hypothetical protein